MLATILLCALQGLGLEGTVVDADGRTIVGAHVYITAARPRRGVGNL